MMNLNDTIEEVYEQSKKDPCRSLYLSVIFQALLDVTKPKQKEEDSEIRLQRDQAHAWFFTSIGVTCENFEFICDYAGLTPKTIRKFAYHIINSDNTVYIRKKITSLLG
jgi:lipoprotein NlpI